MFLYLFGTWRTHSRILTQSCMLLLTCLWRSWGTGAASSRPRRWARCSPPAWGRGTRWWAPRHLTEYSPTLETPDRATAWQREKFTSRKLPRRRINGYVVVQCLTICSASRSGTAGITLTPSSSSFPADSLANTQWRCSRLFPSSANSCKKKAICFGLLGCKVGPLQY